MRQHARPSLLSCCIGDRNAVRFLFGLCYSSRMRASHAVAAAAALVLGTGLPLAVRAQNPSTESIIQSLRPAGGAETGITQQPNRGVHRFEPSTGRAAPAVNLTVQFATGSARLTPAARHTLDSLGRALSSPSLAGYRFRIEGHTDTVGSTTLNQQLSQRRAERVVDYLEQKFGVAPDRLTAIGLGEQHLLVPTPPNTPEPRNRRVMVVNIGA